MAIYRLSVTTKEFLSQCNLTGYLKQFTFGFMLKFQSSFVHLASQVETRPVAIVKSKVIFYMFEKHCVGVKFLFEEF